MPLQRVYKTEAIILKGLKLNEADKILTLYTPNQGKIKAIAKGVSRPKSKLRGHVESLTYSTLMLAHGTNLDIITQGQTINSFLAFRDNLWRTSCALYAAELVDRFTPEHMENRSVFELLRDALHALCLVNDAEIVLRHFELHLLEHSGYRPQLNNCIRCNTSLNPTTNFFSIAGGGVLCPDCQYKESLVQPISLNALKVLRFLQNNNVSSVIHLITTPRLQLELEQLTRNYIRYLIEKETGSSKWLDQIRKLSQTEHKKT